MVSTTSIRLFYYLFRHRQRIFRIYFNLFTVSFAWNACRQFFTVYQRRTLSLVPKADIFFFCSTQTKRNSFFMHILHFFYRFSPHFMHPICSNARETYRWSASQFEHFRMSHRELWIFFFVYSCLAVYCIFWSVVDVYVCAQAAETNKASDSMMARVTHLTMGGTYIA